MTALGEPYLADQQLHQSISCTPITLWYLQYVQKP